MTCLPCRTLGEPCPSCAERDPAADAARPAPDLGDLYRDALRVTGGDTERAVAIALDGFLFRRGEP